MPLPPVPTPPGTLANAGVSNQSATSNAAGLLSKLKQLQEGVNELQQQLSDLVDEVSKANVAPKP